MSNVRVAAVLLFSVVLGACDRTVSRDVVAPDHATPLFNESPDAGIGLSLEGPFDQVLASDDPSAQQAATGGRATGHVGFDTPILTIATERYSFAALSTEPPPPLAAKGEYQLHLRTILGVENKVHGDVICLGVVGNRARIGARIEKAWVNNVPFPLPPGGFFNFWTVTDNGEGTGTPDMASLVRFTVVEATARAHCAVGIVLEQVPIDQGNVQVSSR
jgi:hypothetical protein